jgi:hypothetical protein
MDPGTVQSGGRPANPPGSDDPASTTGVPLAGELPAAVNTAGLALVAVKGVGAGRRTNVNG